MQYQSCTGTLAGTCLPKNTSPFPVHLFPFPSNPPSPIGGPDDNFRIDEDPDCRHHRAGVHRRNSDPLSAPPLRNAPVSLKPHAFVWTMAHQRIMTKESAKTASDNSKRCPWRYKNTTQWIFNDVLKFSNLILMPA